MRFLATVSGDRLHAISNNALDCGRVVERTPPYVSEAQHVELVSNARKTEYSARYDNACSVPDFARSFPGSFPDEQLLSGVRHSDAAAQRMGRPDDAILVYDGMRGQGFPEEPLGLPGAEDVDFTDVGEMQG